MYDIITVTHANRKAPLKLVVGTIVGFEYSDAAKSNIIYSAGGVMFPVLETLEEIEGLLKALNKEKLNE
jgi:hypothetical protein